MPIFFAAVVKTWSPALVGARVEKIQEPAEGLLAIMIYSGGRKRQLCLRFGRKDPFCFVTAQRISVGHLGTHHAFAQVCSRAAYCGLCAAVE